METELNINIDCFLEYTNFKDDLIEYRCLCCNKNYQQKFDEKLKERFFNTYKFSNYDSNKFMLFCEKVFTPINIWMIEKTLMKHHYLKKIFLQSLKHRRYYWCRLCAHKKTL